MRSQQARWVAGLALGAAILLLAGWSLMTAWRGYQLAQFEAEDPSTLSRDTGPIVDRVGVGPLALDVVDLQHGGGTVQVRPHAEPEEPGWPWPAVLVGEHGARYAHTPPTDGAWVPFAVAGALGVALSGAAAWRGRRLLGWTRDRTAFLLFGQDDPATRRFGWLPGHGGHGGPGGQVPPHVPYSPEWDDRDRRIR